MTAPELKRYYVQPRHVDESTDGAFVLYSDVQAYTQAAIAAAMMGAAEYLYKMMMDVSDEALQRHIDFLIADMGEKGQPSYAAYLRDNLLASIPTDATAALAERDKRVREEALEAAAVAMDNRADCRLGITCPTLMVINM